MVGTDSGGDGPDVCTARLTCLRELSAGELAGVRHRGRVAPYGKGRTSRDASSRRGGRRSTPCPRARYRTRVSTVGRQRSRGNEGGNWRTEGGRPSSPHHPPVPFQLSASLRSLRGRYERRVHQSRLHLLPQKRRIAPELLFLPPRFLCASSVVSGTLRGQGRRLLSELSHLPAKSITWHTSQSAQWSLAPYVVKAGGYCQSSLTFLRSPSPGTHHNQEIFQERMAACAPALFQMMEEAPTKHTMELVVRVRDEGQREKAVQVAVLPFLCAHFKEDKNYLYQVFEEGTSITEKLAELPSTPTIIALGINMLK
ncbi:uncharacterized protein LOC142775322 [Rhipicephalus microplus]|uniref:uncharacterized protein LOC142775322 n=1 Tax=Rhipicephalus microplus TaxID=6941 RepID=UPI003F6A90B9